MREEKENTTEEISSEKDIERGKKRKQNGKGNTCTHLMSQKAEKDND